MLKVVSSKDRVRADSSAFTRLPAQTLSMIQVIQAPRFSCFGLLMMVCRMPTIDPS